VIWFLVVPGLFGAAMTTPMFGQFTTGDFSAVRMRGFPRRWNALATIASVLLRMRGGSYVGDTCARVLLMLSKLRHVMILL